MKHLYPLPFQARGQPLDLAKERLPVSELGAGISDRGQQRLQIPPFHRFTDGRDAVPARDLSDGQAIRRLQFPLH